ncbi:MAG: zinc-ribbon domain-containing protein [Lachnospiraceae bacterium]|nr:zinc-ribbon domain-containing protein [Lachnospiraceae bacterium]
MFCEQCGSQVADGVKFCPNCGAAIMYDEPVQGNIAPAQPQTPPPAQPQTPPPMQPQTPPPVQQPQMQTPPPPPVQQPYQQQAPQQVPPPAQPQTPPPPVQQPQMQTPPPPIQQPNQQQAYWQAPQQMPNGQQNYRQAPPNGNQTQRQAPPRGRQPQRQAPPQNNKKKGGFPVVLIVIPIVLLVIVGVIIFAVMRVKKAIEDSPIGEVVEVFSGESAGGVNIPEGAEPVEGSDLRDLIGEYEGEMQMKTLDGIDTMPGAEEHMDQIKAMVDKALSEPGPCTLSINEDGEWEIGIQLMSGMTMSSHDMGMHSVNPSKFNILLVNNGRYSVKLTEEDLKEEGDEGTGSVEHTGVYCEKDGKNLIAGYLDITLEMNGAKVHMKGDFVVEKTTGQYIPEGGEEALDAMNGNKDEGNSDDEDFNDGGSGDDGFGETDENDRNTDIYPEDSFDNSGDNSSEGIDSDNGGDWEPDTGIKSVDTPDPSKTAVTGGKWEQLQSGEFLYTKNGTTVANTWAEDEGQYFYVGPDECLVYNNYAPDGYWVDENGAWDKSVERNELQFEPFNNDYVGQIQTFEITMNDAYTGSGKVYYTGMGGNKTDLSIERLGISSYAAYSAVNENEIYLITVVDDGQSIIVSCDGQTEKCTIQ